ncbi:hypothetical protein CTRC69_03855 [Chlamydia trachomatis RC-F/69]|nr:hypothetical protein E150_03850 [Chlamydia trachomatis E/150]ADH18442.1 hypothetical protein G9768_03825 [Chlamydia trachomatis G/9768]ADH19367.1 hypothetical protein G11222_03845 [Chlamydia trachomatis G/11222]ADH20289.1 hypothetical protein G11074_03820 [Chlamydia trachomatis G/11074]ADH21211.1 hypothetical protein E11023_03815 [Chlamydia trachomatis E/11023]ADH97387.1 hypothetical protein CTG9301_03835 [Chlamydia trachomatis G/9301]AGR94167.1 hypothetical protein CTRC69_03855 [Chlamydia
MKSSPLPYKVKNLCKDNPQTRKMKPFVIILKSCSL